MKKGIYKKIGDSEPVQLVPRRVQAYESKLNIYECFTEWGFGVLIKFSIIKKMASLECTFSLNNDLFVLFLLYLLNKLHETLKIYPVPQDDYFYTYVHYLYW